MSKARLSHADRVIRPLAAHRAGFRLRVRSAVAAAGGIMLDTSPPKLAISLTRLELM